MRLVYFVFRRELASIFVLEEAAKVMGKGLHYFPGDDPGDEPGDITQGR